MTKFIGKICIVLLQIFISIPTICFSQSSTIIAKSAQFRYLDNGSNQGTSWRGLSFNDTSWPLANASLGFGNVNTTTITAGRLTYYFRKTVNFNPASFTDFKMNIRRDDGIVVYINGTEVYRNNMPSGSIAYNTKASSACSDDGASMLSIVLSGNLFLNGNNIIAAEVHNNSTSSSDVTFELELIANGTSAVPCGIPDPNFFTATNQSISSAQVAWAAVSGASSYEVSYRILNSGQAFSGPLVSSSTSLSLTGLQTATTYEFIVRAICASGTGLFSSAGIFTTLSANTPLTAWPAEAWSQADNLTALMDANGLTELSGLFWNGVRNTLLVSHGDGRLRVLQHNTQTNSFSQMANLSIPGGPEGITQVNLNADEFYTIDENYYEIRKYSHTPGFTSATLVNSWNILSLPSIMTNTGNTGPEGIAFVPDSFLIAAGFISERTGQPYTSVNGMGGLLFIAHQNLGQIWVFDVNPNVSNNFSYVGRYFTNKSESCDLAFDRSTGLMYILHNIGLNSIELTDLSSAISGSSRKFNTRKEIELSNPSGNINVEGLAISNRYPDSMNVRVWLCRDIESTESSTYKKDCLRQFAPFDQPENQSNQASVIITTNDRFKYLDNGSNQGTNWRSISFNDASWAEGSAALGFENPHTTPLAGGHITYYFRKTVSIPNPSVFQDFTMNLKRDDGIVVYVNGIEVYRNNMPSGAIAYTTLASSTCSDDGSALLSFTLSPGNFVNGANVIAAEVHNRSIGSSDLTFQLELIGNNAISPMAFNCNNCKEEEIGFEHSNEINRLRNAGMELSAHVDDHIMSLLITQHSGSLSVLVRGEDAGAYSAKLYSLSGQLLFEKEFSLNVDGSTFDIPVYESLYQRPGIYFLTVMNGNNLCRRKLFIN